MAEPDKYLSEVHSTTIFESIHGSDCAVSRFKLFLPSQKEKVLSLRFQRKNKVLASSLNGYQDTDDAGVQADTIKSSIDEDGDLILDRGPSSPEIIQTVLLVRDSLSHNTYLQDNNSDEDDNSCHKKCLPDKEVDTNTHKLPCCSIDYTLHDTVMAVDLRLGACSKDDSKYMRSSCSSIKDPFGSVPVSINENMVTDSKGVTQFEQRIKMRKKRKLISTDDCPANYDCNGHEEIKKKQARNPSQRTDAEDFTFQATETYFINIKHSLATDLTLVGEQVWNGALLLCDYIIHHQSDFQQKLIVDLGAGTGLSSIVAALYAKQVYCTDTGTSVLKLAADNVQTAYDCPTLPTDICPIHVRDLDWSAELSTSDASRFGITGEDLERIKESEVLLAADVIYDNNITDYFFTTVTAMMSHRPNKVLYIGLERRVSIVTSLLFGDDTINLVSVDHVTGLLGNPRLYLKLVFTIEDLDITSPGYNHFRKHLANLPQILYDHQHQQQEDNQKQRLTYTVEQMKTDFPQYIEYNRTKQLEIWKISSVLHNAETKV